MAVYVDELRAVGYTRAGWAGRRTKQACHLMADTEEELEATRKRLGLRPSWRHGDHYDLTYGKRCDAIRLGAVCVTSLELVQLRRAKREAVAKKMFTTEDTESTEQRR